MEIIIMKELMEANDQLAEENRRILPPGTSSHVNLMGAPGSERPL
jgi:hydrogenase nickel incorporation protein HypB